MVACVRRAIDEGIPILNPKWQASASRRDIEQIFRPADGCDEIPLLEERHLALNQLGRFIIDKLNSDICNILRKVRPLYKSVKIFSK